MTTIRRRFRAALNVLRGRPTMFGMHVVVAEAIEVDEPHVLIGNYLDVRNLA